MRALAIAFSVYIASSILPMGAQAQDRQRMIAALTAALGTVSTKASPIFADGQLTGCGVEYAVLAQDWVYQKGGFIRVGGNVSLMIVGNGIAATLKVVLHNIDPRTMSFTPAPPAGAHLIGRDYSTNSKTLVKGGESDTPGAIFLVFQPFPTVEMLMDGVASGRLLLGINRNPKGTAIQVEIDTTVEDKQAGRINSDRTSREFFACTKQLLKR